MLARPDYTKRVSKYLMVLGIIQLLSLDLAGALLIWFSTRIERYHTAFRKAAIAVLSIYVSAGVLAGVYAAVAGTTGTTLGLTGVYRIQSPPLWAVWLLAAAMIVVFGLPLYWLVTPGTRAAFQQRSEGEAALCRNCQYNLRGVEGNCCPECGAAIPFRQVEAADD
jgi:uncharacterized paraquat-inducible protein A